MGKRVENLKENRKKGISMAIVLCVSAFFLAFAAAIVYTAGLLTAEANERLEQERCYQLAKSYAKVLDTELTSYTRKTEENSTTFYGFASRFLDGRYAEYDPGNQDNTVFYYQPVAASMPDPKYGTIKQTRLIMGRALYYIVYIIRTDSINKVILESKKFIRSAYS